MKIACVGGGPGGLYTGILAKKSDPGREVVVYERNRADDTFGFGVVFSDETLDNLADADPQTFDAIRASFSHWDAIDVHYGGERLRSAGHGFSGLSRRRLLRILQARAESLGVIVHYEHEIPSVDALSHDADLVVAADGVNSQIRTAWAEHFRPRIRLGTTRFIWLGTTRRFPAFTFYFRENEHGLWRVHAYNYDREHSTFIVECTEAAWRAAGLDAASEDESVAYCAELFADALDGHPLLKNRSIWRQFPTISNAQWSHDNVVLVGDAAHTAHFSIGSGTKLAMEGAMALVQALDEGGDVPPALEAYTAARRPVVESTQRAAAVSMAWFEETERYFGRLDPVDFGFSLITRSLRINHENLARRDPAFVDRVDRHFAARAGVAVGDDVPPPPPMFTPYRLGNLELNNRVVLSPMCQYSADDGTPGDWHLVHIGSRAVGGAGLILAEMTDVSREGRISPGCTGLYKPEHVTAWRRITDFVHHNGRVPIGVQLGHAGRKGSTRRMWEGIDQSLDEGGWSLISPSPLPYAPGNPMPREMTRHDMVAVRDDFARAASMADEAGFDLVELHFAHGYLLASFLSPITNRRTDEYGGSTQARMRFPLEVFEAVRARWPAHKPMSVRISATDWIEGGFEVDDAVALAAALEALGCDILDVSSGQTDPASKPEYGRLYQTPFSDRIRQEVGIPTMTVGAISSYGDVNSIIASRRADLCVVARAHLFDPYWTRHAAFEQGHDLEWPPQYLPMNRFTPRFEWSPRGQAAGRVPRTTARQPDERSKTK